MTQGEDTGNKRLHNLSIPSTVLLHLNTSTAPNLSIFHLKNAFPTSPRQGAPCPGDISPAVLLTEESFGRPCTTDVALALDFLLFFNCSFGRSALSKKAGAPSLPMTKPVFCAMQHLIFGICANTSMWDCAGLSVHPELLGENLRAWLCMRLH